MTEPIDRTKAPDPLPEVLPKGTRWRNHSYHGVFTGPNLLIDGNRWRGEMSYDVLAVGEPDQYTRHGEADPSWIDWPSYYAALSQSQPAKWTPKVGDRVEWDDNKNGYVSGYGILTGRVREDRDNTARFGLRLGVDRDDGAANRVGFWWVNAVLLRPANASGTAGSVDAAHRETAAEEPSGSSASTSTQPAVPVRHDPYVEHRVNVEDDAPFLSWAALQDGTRVHCPRGGYSTGDDERLVMIARRRVLYREQASAQLDRPLRTGPLRNRDRYGQKLSLHGWETDPDE